MKRKELIEMLESIRRNNSGATLYNYKECRYDCGYQYSATENSTENTAADIESAAAMVEAFAGSCGIWYDDGLFYIETSYWIQNKESAVKIAKHYNQKSIYDWKNNSYITIC